MAMSVGLVSATDRELPKLASKENRLYQNLIQTTAEINPGNSGGPLFDINGHVVGVNTAVVLPQKNTFGIGFAMPITGHLLAEVEDLKQGKEVVYGFVGVSVTTATPRECASAGLKKPQGVHIDMVEANSPAAKAGLKESDLIVQIGDRQVRDSSSFVRAVGDAWVDVPTQFTIFRGDREIQLPVTLRRRPMPQVAINRTNQRLRWNGLLLGPVPANWQPDKDKKATGVMVIAIENPGKNKAKLQQGTIISSVGGRAVASIADLQQVLATLPAEQCTIETLHDRAVAAVDQSAAQPH
jgi:serine protease Do